MNAAAAAGLHLVFLQHVAVITYIAGLSRPSPVTARQQEVALYDDVIYHVITRASL